MYQMLSKPELVGALCTVLAFASAGQILITGVLFFEFPHFLTFSHCHLATAAGVISGLVAVPMVIQLKTAQISHHIELKYGYTKWYQVLAIFVCAGLHFAADVLAITAFAMPRKWDNEFLEKMEVYNEKTSAKSVVDNIQWALQCCGAKSYKDWNSVPWAKLSESRISRNFGLVQPSDPETVLVNSVPFSCCAKKVLDVCLHYNLLHYGINTINTIGCASQVESTAYIILSIEFGMYTLCIIIESIILACLLSDTDASEIQKNELLRKYLFKKKYPSTIMDGKSKKARDPEKPEIKKGNSK